MMLSLVYNAESASAPVEETAVRGIAVWSEGEEAQMWLEAALAPLGFQLHRDLTNPDDVAILFLDRVGHELPIQLMKVRAQRSQPMLVITNDRDVRLVALSLGIPDIVSMPPDLMELNLRIERLTTAHRDRQRLRVCAEAELRLRHDRQEQATLLIHDLKNPISTILANVEFAREALTDPPLASEALEDAGVGCRRALRLLGNLLDVARNEAGRFSVRRQRQLLGPMLVDVAHELEVRVRGRAIAIRIEAPPELELDADLELLRRAVENVLDNAIRYVPDGGEVAISVQRVPGGTELRVGNSGPAIPLGDRERIFEKYERGKDGSQFNLGLGLHFCRLVAIAHGGRIAVEQAHLPTEFVFFLPDV